MTDETFDVIVIGAGMAGASIGYELSAHIRVLVLERESAPGYHTTGRSAALFSGIYGAAPVRTLSRASRDFFEQPPDGFATTPLLAPRGCLFPADAEHLGLLDDLFNEEPAALRRVSGEAGRALAPILREEACVSALYEPDSYDIDVNGLHQGYLRGLRAAGGRLATDVEINAITRSAGVWRVETRAAIWEAPALVNAAGAWADSIAEAAGAQALGLSPLRRTVILTDPPPDDDFRAWPCVIDADEAYYFKPDAGRLLISPADETPSAACDAQPDDLDIAIAVDRFERATTWPVRRISHRWAGLRTFAPDRVQVIGWDPRVEGFFWLAGQGGYGIQTAPAAARLAAALLRGVPVTPRLQDHRVDPAAYDPARFS